MLVPAEIEELTARIARCLEPERIILFGSYAKGTATIHSDIDLMVVKQTDLPMSRRADRIASLLCRCLVPVDVHVYTPEEIAEYGREPLGFVASVIETGRTVFEAGRGAEVSRRAAT